MARAVLEHLDESLKPAFAALDDDRPPAEKLEALLRIVDEFYDSGRAACLLERLSASVERELFAAPLKTSFGAIMRAFETLAVQAGAPRKEARLRAEEAVVNIQGSLVVAAGVGSAAVFGRALDRIRHGLLADAPEPEPTKATRAR